MMGRFRAKRGTLLALPTAWTGFAVMLLSCSASLADAQVSGNCTEFPQLYVTRKGTTLTVVRAEPFVANQTEEDVCICSPVFDVAGVNATCSSNHSEEVNCLTLPTDDEIEVELDSKVLTENASLCLFSECGNKDCTIFDPFRDKEVTISALDVVPESSSAISLTWNVSGVYGDTVIRSHVTWCTEDNNCSVQATCLEEKPPLISERDVLHTSVRIDGLRPAASLKIRVSPVGLLGNTSEGCFLTPSEVLDPVASISAVATEIDSLRISWTQPADYNDSIDSYELRYCLREENVDCPLKQQQQEGLNSCLAPGNVILKEEGTYNISGVMPGSIVLVGVNRTRRYPSGVQGSSAETVECFKAFSPGNVTNVVEQDIGSRRLSLQWNFSEEAKQQVQPSAYNVTWCVFSTDTNCTIADCKETEGNSTTVQGDTLDIEDLMPWSVVSVKVSPLYWNGSEQISLGAPGSTCFRTLAEAPATVKHLQVRPEATWAIVEWKEPERKNGPLDGYILKLCHATDYAQGSCSDDASENLTINSSINEQRVDGLTPWTNYTVIVVAFNNDTNGFEMTSAEVVMEFQTEAAAPEEVKDLTVKTVEATSATVEWKEPKVKNGPLDGYILVWCLSSDYVKNECAEARSETVTINSSAITEKKLTDLNPWTKYKVTVVAFNKDKNDSEMMSDIAVEEFETDGEVPGAVTKLSAIEVTNQSLSLTWATPDISPDYPQHYRITYCLTDICSSALPISDSVNWNSSECKTVNATRKDAKLTGLRPWTWIAVRVTAASIRRDGTELFGSADTICERTKMGVPGKPENIFAEAGIDAITISWKPPAVPNGEITSYKIYVCIVENDTCDTLNWPGNKTRVVLENMLPWTLYNVSLAAQNKEDGILLEGEAIAATVKTLSAAPSEPRKLAWNEMRENILVTWEEPENPRGPLSGYDVSWTITDWLGRTTGSDSLNTSDKEAQIPRLAYSNYTISVKAFNDLQHGARLYGAATSTAFRSAVGAPGLPAVDMEVGARTAAVYMSVQKSPNGPLDGFLWTNCPTAQNNEREACANENTPKHLIMLKKLKPWTEYTFRVRAYNLGPNNATLTGPSNFRTYKTDPAEPSVVRNFSVAKIESRTLFVNWLEPVAKNGDHPDYVLSWGPVGDSEQNHTEVTARSVALPYLQPYTEYLLEVFAYNRYQGERLQGPSSSAKARTLPEVPGPVRNLMAKPFKNNTVLLTWSAPTEPRGVLLGYVVIYNATKPDKPSKPTVEIKDDSLLSSSACEGSQCTFELRGLAAEYRYIFDVRGINVNVTGLGDPVGSPEVILLPAGDPPPPKNLSLMTPDCPSASQPDSQKAFVFSKDMFDDTNGEIIYYEVVVGSAGLISENITAQQAWSELSRKQPTPPHKITPKGWNPFKKGVDSVDPLNCQPMHGETDTVVCTIGLEKCDSTNMEPCNGPLRGGTEYAMYVIGHTHGGSRPSDPEVFVTALLPETSSAGAIVGGILTAVVIMVAILAVLIIHRRRLARQKQAKRPSCDSANMNNSVDHFISRSDVNGIPRKPIPPVPQEETIEMEHHVIKDINKPIPKTEFKEYLEVMLKDSGYRFADEYERLVELSPQYPSDVARNPANSKKNRFTNIHPFDKSRVPLSVLGEDEQTSYINASFVKGCNSDREYIAAQGPNSLTVNDFWRMIWEHDVKTIIMLTQFVEANKKKCEKYWPDDNKEHAYGSVLVRKDTSTDFNDYTLTEFKIKSDDSSKWRNVRHIFFTAWKDHGVPEKPQTLIQFVRTCQGMFGRRGGAQPPILVHCSAGVGRTGTFIALDMCLQKLELEDDIDIFHLILDLRECRRCMVQNEKQYTYLYHCVAAVIDEMGGKTIQDEPIYENVSVLLSGSTC